MVQPLGPQPPEKRTIDSLIRADLAFLAIELLLIGLLVIGLLTSSAAHAEAAKLILGGPYTVDLLGRGRRSSGSSCRSRCRRSSSAIASRTPSCRPCSCSPAASRCAG